MATGRIKIRYKNGKIIENKGYFSVFYLSPASLPFYSITSVNSEIACGKRIPKFSFLGNTYVTHNILIPLPWYVSKLFVESILNTKFMDSQYCQRLTSFDPDISKTYICGFTNHLNVLIITKEELKQYMRQNPEKFKYALK